MRKVGSSSSPHFNTTIKILTHDQHIVKICNEKHFVEIKLLQSEIAVGNVKILMGILYISQYKISLFVQKLN